MHGPYAPDEGHRFNPNKLVLDPYARAHIGALNWNPALFAYKVGDPQADLSFDERDSAPFMPKCVVVDPDFDWKQEKVVAAGAVGPHHRLRDARARLSPSCIRRCPSTSAAPTPASRSKEVIDYIKSLGVTTVELLPVHTFINDSSCSNSKLTNYWGYNSIGFFAPDPRYAADPSKSLQEFKEMVARFHDAGLEVIIDVVYNHTAEGNELGPTLSFKGIDNASYYRLMPDKKRYYINDTGTGNTLNLSHPLVIQMVTDSLRYWAEEMHVDGFRFDLGTILAREPGGFDTHNGFMKAVMQDPLLAKVKLIAEPWDCGPGGYQVGGFPPGWAEWNDKYRDTVRDYWRAKPRRRRWRRACAARPTSSTAAAASRGRASTSSPRTTASRSTTSSPTTTSTTRPTARTTRTATRTTARGTTAPRAPTDDEPIRGLRKRQMKNMLATLLLSQGTPMLLAGDEFARTQKGNNNAYCQDNEISWLDWNHDDRAERLIDFVRKLTGLRHHYPILRRTRFLTGEYNEELGVKDVSWINADRRGDARGALEGRQRALLRHAARRPRADHRHPQARRGGDAAHHLQPLAGRGEVQAAARRTAARAGRCSPTPTSRTPRKSRASRSATSTRSPARSLLLFELA